MSSQGIGVMAGPDLPRTPTQLFIAGAWRDAADGATFDVISPTSEQRLATVAAAGGADIDAAVEAARAQVDGGEWARMTGADRGRLLTRLADAMERDAEIFVTLEAHDVGKPAFEPRMVDIPNAIDVIRHFAGWADKIEGRWVTPLPAFGRQRQAYTIREPTGVIGAITAWNAPTLIAAWKLGPALAAGNAVVLKPAEDAPLTSLHLAALIEEVRLDAEPVRGPPARGAAARRRRLDQRSRRARCAPALGRPQDERHGSRARLGRDRGKHRGEDRHDHPVTGPAPVVIATREEMDERV